MSDGGVNPMKAGLEDVVVSPSDIYTGLTDEKYVPLAPR